MLDPISTKLYQKFDLKGHVGVTEVKRSFLWKMLLLVHASVDFDETGSE